MEKHKPQQLCTQIQKHERGRILEVATTLDRIYAEKLKKDEEIKNGQIGKMNKFRPLEFEQWRELNYQKAKDILINNKTK